MNERNANKKAHQYRKLFEETLKAKYFKNVEFQAEKYSEMLKEMYLSNQYKEYCKYPTMPIDRIYAVIAMCLTLKEMNLSNEEIIAFVNDAFEKTRSAVRKLMQVIDTFPCAYRIARKWNINDHEKRIQDGSVTYDYFEVKDNQIEYSISKCMYVELFASYGIRELCKIMCNTDINAYTSLVKHVDFFRYSDLSDGDFCHDLIRRK